MRNNRLDRYPTTGLPNSQKTSDTIRISTTSRGFVTPGSASQCAVTPDPRLD